MTDTVPFAESATEEQPGETVYTASLSEDGHLLLTDGRVTPYRPVYENDKLVGSVRDGAANVAVNPAEFRVVPLGLAAVEPLQLQTVADTSTPVPANAMQPVTVTEAPAETPAPAHTGADRSAGPHAGADPGPNRSPDPGAHGHTGADSQPHPGADRSPHAKPCPHRHPRPDRRLA